MKKFNPVVRPQLKLPRPEHGLLRQLVDVIEKPLQDMIEKLVNQINDAIKSLVARLNEAGPIWGHYETVTIQFTATDDVLGATDEYAVRHNLGFVPSGFLITRIKPNIHTNADGLAWGTGVALDEPLREGRTAWTNSHVFFYVYPPLISYRCTVTILLLP